MTKRWSMLACVVLGVAFGVAGCTSDPPENGGGGDPPKNGSVTLKAYPKAGDWVPVGTLVRYPSNSNELDMYTGEGRGKELRENGLDSLLVKQYAPDGWDKIKDKDGKSKPDIRRIRVELFAYRASIGAGTTFQEWHRGESISDVGEKAFAESDAIVFLRGSIVVRLFPTGPWTPKSAGTPTIVVAKAIDAWLQGK